MIVVLNTNEPFPVIVRLSAPLSCRTSPVPAKPETDPPTVKGPPPEPEPEPEPEPTGPLQAERTREVRVRDTETTDLKVDFIAIDCSFGTSRLKDCGKLPGIRHSPWLAQAGPKYASGILFECGIVWAGHMDINHLPSVRSVLCAFYRGKIQ